ncbi:3'(2'),5'-bisphosphate nucleotidase CysQ [Pseudenhygromyxa sp. WMMC2535]|uniref:3'(2'),5'-bisphosphate nucleotidase CysQ family protein n=1 Tax=Pseudenhygromyxa sp. WMMC2535 TaxID=2712867 RepID=UPI0015546B28|nr:3'(2'),5'-bisphosphate nucleotidase CysQ [Pseudenhygromyxa sp. WMMC2535]NVB42161.1 3'(2'),5'-bisphosphate nucleotidase CysQ [Pseudenhygromyxa sp. WMMC2535]
MQTFDQELHTAIDLATECGAIALALQAGGPERLQTRDKADDQGPVTAADLAVEARIIAGLRERFPDDAILAEESAVDSAWPTAERVWMIDPIDGTRDFAQGAACWAIHIGLCVRGVPALGVVHEPRAERTSWAIDHEDTQLAWTRVDGGPPLALHGIRERRQPRWGLVASRSHRSPRIDPIIAALGLRDDQVQRTGSCGVKLAMIARADARAYAHPTLGTKLWDSCAPHVILRAAGGRLTTMTGAPISYAGPDIAHTQGLLATAPGVDHDAVVAALRPLTREWYG